MFIINFNANQAFIISAMSYILLNIAKVTFLRNLNTSMLLKS